MDAGPTYRIKAAEPRIVRVPSFDEIEAVWHDTPSITYEEMAKRLETTVTAILAAIDLHMAQVA